MRHTIILAAGKGMRMHSQRPKVLTELCGKTFLRRVIEATSVICEIPTIVVGYMADVVMRETGEEYRYVIQREQHGTGHALLCARAGFVNSGADTILVVNGDQPLIRPASFVSIMTEHELSGAALTITTAVVPHFNGDFALFDDYGRVVRSAKGVMKRIVEAREANRQELTIREVNVGCYCFNADWLWPALDLITNANKAGEYYITDLVHTAFNQQTPIHTATIGSVMEGIGVNTSEHFEIAKRYLS